MYRSSVPSRVRRLLLLSAAALIAMLASAAPARVAANEPPSWILPEDDVEVRIPVLAPEPLARTSLPEPSGEPVSPAYEPEDSDGEPRSTPRPAPTRTARPSPEASPEASRAPTPESTPEPSAAPASPVGYDISYPQCGRLYPLTFAFAIVGVNGGRVYSQNPCLGPGGDRSQLAWAGPEAELYFNTGNPGPRISRYWPNGQADPRACDTDDDPGEDTLDCSFVYGWNAAEYAYATALRAYVDLGWLEADEERLPRGTAIWLDVEPANSWRFDPDLNVAALEGAVAYLESMEVERIGFYSTPRLWGRITGGTDRFSDYPAWHAGARDRADAERRCLEEPAFTGGQLAMVKWVENGLDANVRCADLEVAP